MREHLALLAIERFDLRTVVVEQPQAQAGRRVIAAPAVAARERRQTRPDRIGVGQVFAQLVRQLAQQIFGLADQVLAAGED